jgi:hypothetical protein
MSTAIKTAEAPLEGLEVYRVRDDLAQSYNPANALERMLVTQMAQSWLRLQRACEAEERYLRAHDVLEAIANEFDRYKAITRQVTDCERAWRHAMLHLEKAQRRRKQTDLSSPNARRRQLPEPVAESEPTAPAPANPAKTPIELAAGPAPSVAKIGRPESSSRAG